MKYILLGSGKIAEQFLDVYFHKYLNFAELVALVAPERFGSKYLENVYKTKDLKRVILNPEKRQEAVIKEIVLETKPDFILSIQYPWILSSDLLQVVNGKVLNLHNARLPDYRGHNCISHEILNGESIHTTTLHWMDQKVDSGKVVIIRNIPINNRDTAYSLWQRSVEASLIVLDEFFCCCQRFVSDFSGQKVPRGGHFYSKSCIDALKKIPENASLEEMDRIARAFWFPPHEPAYLNNNGCRLYILPNSYNYTLDNEL